MRVISTEKLPIKMWIEDIEEGALLQTKNLANLPFAFRHVAIMPDSHQGYGMPIGGVLATNGCVIPNAVGVDIGCGMYAIKFDAFSSNVTKEQMKAIMGKIRALIPMGFEHHKDKHNIPNVEPEGADTPIVIQQWEAAQSQLGTLGGGNHFIEIQRGASDGALWVMLHSGSRNLGKKVADHYNEVAVKLNERWFSTVPKEWELAFLPIETREAKEYLAEMNYCVKFAFANRFEMALKIKEAVWDVLGAVELEAHNIAHNYARWEHHFGKDVIVHRKGATSAKLGEIGLIPGSQGSKSFMVEGLGNQESFMSCSHGAGRKMGRKAAQRELNLEEEIRKMNDKGIIHGIRTAKDLDESAGAYKDIDVVMEQQKDLVKIVEELTPLAVLKG